MITVAAIYRRCMMDIHYHYDNTTKLAGFDFLVLEKTLPIVGTYTVNENSIKIKIN